MFSSPTTNVNGARGQPDPRGVRASPPAAARGTGGRSLQRQPDAPVGARRRARKTDVPKPIRRSCPASSTTRHCHSSEEEVFVVLEGDGVCILGEEEHTVRAGSVVARPPHTRLDHAFRAGADGMKLLAYGTPEPNDIAWYPRSKKVYSRGVGLLTHLPIDHWDADRLPSCRSSPFYPADTQTARDARPRRSGAQTGHERCPSAPAFPDPTTLATFTRGLRGCHLRSS